MSRNSVFKKHQMQLNPHELLKIEAEIEEAIERKIDRLDEEFIGGMISEVEYEASMKNINRWGEKEYLRRTSEVLKNRWTVHFSSWL